MPSKGGKVSVSSDRRGGTDRQKQDDLTDIFISGLYKLMKKSNLDSSTYRSKAMFSVLLTLLNV